MDSAKALEEELNKFKEDIILLEDAWQKNLPSCESIINSINTYLVPYYKKKGALELRNIIDEGFLKVSSDDFKAALKDVNKMEQEKAKYVIFFMNTLKKANPIDSEELIKEIQYYIKPFYKVVGAKESIEKLLGNLTKKT